MPFSVKIPFRNLIPIKVKIEWLLGQVAHRKAKVTFCRTFPHIWRRVWVQHVFPYCTMSYIHDCFRLITARLPAHHLLSTWKFCLIMTLMIRY